MRKEEREEGGLGGMWEEREYCQRQECYQALSSPCLRGESGDNNTSGWALSHHSSFIFHLSYCSPLITHEELGLKNSENPSKQDPRSFSQRRCYYCFYTQNLYETLMGFNQYSQAQSITLSILSFWICQALQNLVSCPNLTHERRGSGDVMLIPRISLTLITFWREIFLRQSHCRKHNL